MDLPFSALNINFISLIHGLPNPKFRHICGSEIGGVMLNAQ